MTTLDIVSSGRAILGIGAAWNEDEHRGYGYEFPPVGERISRLEEALQICRAMFREEAPTYEGRYYRIQGALNFPRPVQPNGPPIMIGGGGEQRTLKLVAQYADMCNIFGDVATVRHKMDVLARHCETVGRDPSTIIKTRLGSLIIRKTDAEAERLFDQVLNHPGRGSITTGPAPRSSSVAPTASSSKLRPCWMRDWMVLSSTCRTWRIPRRSRWRAKHLPACGSPPRLDSRPDDG